MITLKKEFIIHFTPFYDALHDNVRKTRIFTFFIKMAAILDYVKLM